jgi:hypothetical protein
MTLVSSTTFSPTFRGGGVVIGIFDFAFANILE